MEARGVPAEVPRHHADLLGRDVQLVRARVLEDEVVALGARQLAVDHTPVPPDAVDPMHREVSGLELIGDGHGRAAREAGRGPRVPPGAEEILFRDHREAAGREHEARRERCLDPLHGQVAHDLGGAFERAVTATDEQDPGPVGRRSLEPACEFGRIARGRPPSGHAEVDSLSELRQVELDVAGDRILDRGDHLRSRPADGLRERRRLRVGLGRALERPLGLGHGHPAPRREQLGGHRHPIEQERCERVGSLEAEPVGEPLHAVAEPVGQVRRASLGDREEVVIG
jgi:hypothetical protein